MAKEAQKEAFTSLLVEWGLENIRSNFTKDKWIRLLLSSFTVSCPWEMDDCLYYAQLAYPDTTIEDIKRIYNEK